MYLALFTVQSKKGFMEREVLEISRVVQSAMAPREKQKIMATRQTRDRAAKRSAQVQQADAVAEMSQNLKVPTAYEIFVEQEIQAIGAGDRVPVKLVEHAHKALTERWRTMHEEERLLYEEMRSEAAEAASIPHASHSNLGDDSAFTSAMVTMMRSSSGQPPEWVSEENEL